MSLMSLMSLLSLIHGIPGTSAEFELIIQVPREADRPEHFSKSEFRQGIDCDYLEELYFNALACTDDLCWPQPS
jgi:hypothetical protein